MLRFITRRCLYGVLVLFGVIVIVFFLFNVLPGDPARMMLGKRADAESLAMINKDLGLDKPLGIQFLMYINDLSPLSFHNNTDKESPFLLDDRYTSISLLSIGSFSMILKAPYLRRSYQSKKKVSELLLSRFPETAVLAIAAILIGLIFGVAIGIIAALKQGSPIDSFAVFFSALGISGPAFFVGIIVAWVGGYLLSDLTGLNMTGSLFTLDDYGDHEFLDLRNLILPALTLGIRPLAVIMQLTRSSMIEALSQDYVRTARAKGLPYRTVVLKHALKNALNPVLTASSGWFAGLMAGAVFVEIIFDWKGIGYEIVNALNFQDLPVVMGGVLMVTAIFVIVNILVDLLYGFLDPRIRVS